MSTVLLSGEPRVAATPSSHLSDRFWNTFQVYRVAVYPGLLERFPVERYSECGEQVHALADQVSARLSIEPEE